VARKAAGALFDRHTLWAPEMQGSAWVRLALRSVGMFQRGFTSPTNRCRGADIERSANERGDHGHCPLTYSNPALLNRALGPFPALSALRKGISAAVIRSTSDGLLDCRVAAIPVSFTIGSTSRSCSKVSVHGPVLGNVFCATKLNRKRRARVSN